MQAVLDASPLRTTYQKLDPAVLAPTTDPLSGLFLGTFGPHGPELLHLERTLDVDGDPAIVATKLTGDRNVPAGEVSFMAKIGPKHKEKSQGIYPDHLRIKARYPGRGRVADYRYANPHWTPGELVQFQSLSAVVGDAELGFMWSVAHKGTTKRFLICLHRIQLPDIH